MLSILEVEPKIFGMPKESLRRAAETLRQVAEKVDLQEAEARRIKNGVRNQYISRVLPNAKPPLPQPPSIDQFKQAIGRRVAANYGKVKGPSETFFSELDSFAKRAFQAGYSLNNAEVQDAFMAFLMEYVTAGFEDSDTTGTIIGNYKGYWPGGGFGT